MHIEVVESILKLNDDVARHNRQVLRDAGVFAIDVIGGPGCGKTTLLQNTVAALRHEMRIGVIVGDLTTARDAERFARVCPDVVQINTGKGCHLEAHQVRQAMERLDVPALDLLIIENVGNLVCPVGFDLGQDAKIGMFCTTEGADKPAKYPHLVHAADLLLLNKVDLLPYLSFDLAGFHADIRHLKPAARVLEVSAQRGQIDAWLTWLRQQVQARATPHPRPAPAAAPVGDVVP
jgi:hydrogenase nickel incorporation protein HypB